MRQALKLHPDSPRSAVSGVTAELTRPRPGLLSLRYVLAGEMEALVLPAPAALARTDGLWRRTCFEAFVRPWPGDAYCEFNLSPSGQWAAYRFDRYREGMTPVEAFAAPLVDSARTTDGFELQALLNLERLPDLATAPTWSFGLSAVIEAADGGLSYWALAHPPGKADFHHPDCFALQTPATERP